MSSQRFPEPVKCARCGNETIGTYPGALCRVCWPLDAYERWMVEQNVAHAETESAETVVAALVANGYGRVADAVVARLATDR